MQYKVVSRPQKIATKKPPKTLGVFEALIHKYSQTTPENPAGTTMDPQAVQMGQSIFDPTGKEFIVVEDDPTTTYKTIMPKDQQGQQIPEGVTTVDDSELSVDYSVQQPTETITAKLAPEFKRT